MAEKQGSGGYKTADTFAGVGVKAESAEKAYSSIAAEGQRLRCMFRTDFALSREASYGLWEESRELCSIARFDQ
jgi:hypothetical protein